LLVLFLAACGAPSAPSDLSAQLHPYDWRGKTPEKLRALLSADAPLSARYAVANARLDWLLTAWLNRDNVLLGLLGDHLGIPRCSQREQFDACLESIPANIREQLGEADSSVPEAADLRSLLAALSTNPRSAVQAAAIEAAIARGGPSKLRAQLALAASARTRLAGLSWSQERALATLLQGVPFACPDRFLSLTEKDSDEAANGLAPFCSYACPAHQSPDHREELLWKNCPPEHFGLTREQGAFLAPRNFLLHRAFQPLTDALNALETLSPQDPLHHFLTPGLNAFAQELAALRLPAALPRTLPISGEDAPLVEPQKPLYVWVSEESAGVALWPTFGLSGAPGQRLASLREGEFLHPGRVLSSDPAALARALNAALEQDRSLGERLPFRAPAPASAPASEPSPDPTPTPDPEPPLTIEPGWTMMRPASSSPSGLNPEGTRPPGDVLDWFVSPGTTLERLFPLALAAREAGFGRFRLLTRAGSPSGLRALEWLPTRGEELAFPAKTPRGFPGGAMVILLQPSGIRSVLLPGLETSALPPLALSGVARGESGFDPQSLQDFWMTFLPQRVIVAVAPSLRVGDLARVLSGLARRAPSAPVAVVLAPEEGSPSWLATLPKARYPEFLPLAPADYFDPDSALDPF
jgi:hypothetical protein